jgi:biopolymer transport protein ExbD
VYVGLEGPEAVAGADGDGTAITISNFPFSVLDVPFESSADNSKLGFDANPAVVPPVGTPAEIILRPTGERVTPKKVEIEVILRRGQPLLLDGQPMTLEKFAETVKGMPVEIQNAVLRAEPEESFGRVMEVYDILGEALMKTKLVVLRPPATLTVSAESKVRVAGETLSLEVFTARAEKLLKGVQRVDVVADAKAEPKAVKAVVDVVRMLGLRVNMHKPETAPEKPAAK